MTEQEFRNYLAAGIVCQTLWPGVEERTPVAYLYGPDKVRLPKLPENKYPYAYIVGDGTRSASLYCTAESLQYGPGLSVDGYETEDDILHSNGKYVAYVRYNWTKYSGGWTYKGETLTDWIGVHSDVIWANADLYRTDGTCYMNGTNPIPVYE